MPDLATENYFFQMAQGLDGYFQRCDWYFQMLFVFSDLNDIWAHLKANFVR